MWCGPPGKRSSTACFAAVRPNAMAVAPEVRCAPVLGRIGRAPSCMGRPRDGGCEPDMWCGPPGKRSSTACFTAVRPTAMAVASEVRYAPVLGRIGRAPSCMGRPRDEGCEPDKWCGPPGKRSSTACFTAVRPAAMAVAPEARCAPVPGRIGRASSCMGRPRDEGCEPDMWCGSPGKRSSTACFTAVRPTAMAVAPEVRYAPVPGRIGRAPSCMGRPRDGGCELDMRNLGCEPDMRNLDCELAPA